MHNLPTPKTEAALQSPYERARAIQQALDRAARYLPTQGPIDVFVAQNILQGFEDEPFEEAVVHAARVYGTEPFLAESRYREELAVGRIRDADLVAVLEADLGPSGGELLAGGRVPLQTLLLELLRHPVRQEEDVAVRWTLTESDAVERPATADLDQGVAAWPMPGRERGFLVAIVDLYANRFGPTEPWPGWGRSFRSSAQTAAAARGHRADHLHRPRQPRHTRGRKGRLPIRGYSMRWLPITRSSSQLPGKPHR